MSDATAPDKLDAEAGEYVLGTLDAAERAAVAARRQREPDLDAAIIAWEQRLSPLNDVMQPINPPPELWARIVARLDAASPDAVLMLNRSVNRWRRTALAAGSLAATLLAVIGIREYDRAQDRASAPSNFVAVFQKDDALPSFLLTVDLKTRQLTIRPVNAQTPAGKTYQLWIATADSGGKPRSLGLVEAAGLTTTRAALAPFDAGVVQAATYGVSLEPAGGSPTGQPTGPVFHAKLVQATP